ncbi:MAG: HD domain-containing protein [Desulfomicrobiaceae bacterium]
MTIKQTYLSDLAPGDPVADLFAVTAAQRREAKNGRYWQITLMDKSGQMEARIWSPASQAVTDVPRGAIARVEGTVTSYNGQTQINITAFRLVDPASVDLADFMAVSATPAAELLAQVEALLDAGLTYAPWRTLCSLVLTDPEIRAALSTAPGAKKVHHAYLGGLLEHTLAVMRLTQSIAALYPEADQEILLVATLFHDLGKAFEIRTGLDREYTDAGRLIGHLVLGMEILDRFLAQVPELPEGLALHLRHLVVSHHGQPEFGTPREPMTVEAFILHFADNLDAKIATTRAALAGCAPLSWSERIPALGRAVFEPLRTPRPASAATAPANHKAQA